MSNFVSYSRVDEPLVIPIVEVLRLGDPKAFRDRDSIAPGKLWAAEIDRALQSSERVVVMWTTAASESRYVEAEYSEAIRMGKDVVPVLLDDTPLPASLIPYQTVDFRPTVQAAAKTRALSLAQRLLALGRDLVHRPDWGAAHPIYTEIIADLIIEKASISFSERDQSELRTLLHKRVRRVDGEA